MRKQRANLAMAPRAGFEPATNRLTAGCSTAELPGKSLLGAMKAAYNKAAAALKAAAAATAVPEINDGNWGFLEGVSSGAVDEVFAVHSGSFLGSHLHRKTRRGAKPTMVPPSRRPSRRP